MAQTWQFFANGFVLAESTKLRKATNFAEANEESRSWEKHDTKRCKGSHFATCTS
jgi:hypothetical protein